MLSLMHLAAGIVAIAQLGASVFPTGHLRLHRSHGSNDREVKQRSHGATTEKLPTGNLRRPRSHVAMSRGSNDREVKPHIVFVLADDMGYNSIGYMNAEIKTPALDKLANEGVKLRSYYAAPICGPSRFSLLTGRAPWKSEAWKSNQFESGIPAATSLNYVMLPAALKAAGYKTHMVGKWHLGYYSQDYWPQNRGFDTFYGSLQGCVYHQSQEVCEARCRHGGRLLDLVDSTRQVTVDDINASVVADDRYRIRAVELIRNHNRKQPMFLYVSFHHPHAPLDAPAQYSSQFKFDEPAKNRYYGMLMNLDDNVEEIRKALIEADMWQNTVMVFASDNGGSTVEISPSFQQELNYPLQGFKGHVEEGGIKVPAFVGGGFLPDRAKGLQLDGLTSVADWYATLAGLAGAHVGQSGPYQSDSINNWKYLIGESNVSATHKVLQFASSKDYAVIEGSWKLHVRIEGNTKRLRLFNLKADPSAVHDVIKGKSQIVSRLQTSFTVEPFWKLVKYVGRLQTCNEIGFTPEAFSRNWCSIGSDVFLKDFASNQRSYTACSS